MSSEPITVEYNDHMGNDLTVVNAARVSYSASSDWADFIRDAARGTGGLLYKDDYNLIRFLARGMTTKDYDALVKEAANTDNPDDLIAILEGYRSVPLHKSPFNHAFASFTVYAPIYVARQLVKHEYLPWNEISGRYVEFEPAFHRPEFRFAAKDKKQGSGVSVGTVLQAECGDIADNVCRVAYRAYKDLLRKGVAEEQARTVLPLSLMTQWRWSGSLGAFAKMAHHRLRDDAQEETRQVAKRIDDYMGRYFPASWTALVHPTETALHTDLLRPKVR